MRMPTPGISGDTGGKRRSNGCNEGRISGRDGRSGPLGRTAGGAELSEQVSDQRFVTLIAAFGLGIITAVVLGSASNRHAGEPVQLRRGFAPRGPKEGAVINFRYQGRRFPQWRCRYGLAPDIAFAERWPMPFCIWIAALILATTSVGAAVGQPNTIDAVEPGGQGVLTKCFDWLVASSCRTYHHISLPSRIAVGDTITLSFGSSVKKFGFTVARIALRGDHCEILSQPDAVQHRRDKINVAPCYPADAGR
jgi:hypothetical protein